MSDHIELHDSRLSLTFAGSAVVLQLRPAYVHHWHRSSGTWCGEGRFQAADIVITNAVLASSPGDCVFDVSDGWFEIGDRRHENMLPVPLSGEGVVRGRIALVNGQAIDLCGDAVAVRLLGEPEFVERLPSEWAPR